MDTCNLDEAAIFNSARQMEDPDARQAYILQACGGDGELRRRVEALLRAHDEERGFLESPTRELHALLGVSAGEDLDTPMGPYRLLEKLGEGGMGTVFLAEQTQPVHRQVAIKVIRPGMDSSKILNRFETERQALALMDHPNIAKVLDAGTTPASRPYFVMELIRGLPIAQYCDAQRLTLRERLQMLVPICQAVQHAHQKGIIHRDLKPSNLLIAQYDSKAVPKIIDFGIAKAIGVRLTDRTLTTESGGVIGTPEYMSPEQAEPGQLDIDTRSDIYSLGVVLYELLTGTTPLRGDGMTEAGLFDLLRRIREEEPTKPSTRLSTTEELPEIAVHRGVEPKKLAGLVRGDLDWIVMKCLEKDRTRRYATANSLARDIEHYLNDEPVEAGPPSAGYRLRKYVRRNKGPVLSAVAITLALLGGTAVALWQAVDATRARDVALQAAAAEGAAKDTANAKEEETRAVLQFVENQILAAARPKGQDGGLGPDVSLRAATQSALPFVDKSFKDQPLIEARLRLTLGTSFYYLGDVKTAAEQYDAARVLYARQLGPDHPDTLRSMNNLAGSYDGLGRYADALQLKEETLALRKAKLGPDHPDTLASMNNLAVSYYALGRSADAHTLHEETLALVKAKLGPDHPATLRSMHCLAVSYTALGRSADAHTLHEETLALMKAKLGPDHPDTLWSMRGVAESLIKLERGAEAVPIIDDCIQRASGKVVDPALLLKVIELRLRYFAKSKDGAGCRASAAMWEKLDRRDAESLYNAACLRAITAQVLRDTGATEAAAEADRAIAWLRQAVAAGYRDAVHTATDPDLDVLRDRADFQELLGQLQARSSKDPK